MSVRSTLLTAVLSFSLVCVAGCNNDDYESISKKQNAKIQEAIAVLKDVKDKSSADAAAPKMKSIGEDLDALQKKMAALPKPTEEQAKKYAEKGMKDGFEAAGQLAAEMFRITAAGNMTPELQNALNGMGKNR